MEELVSASPPRGSFGALLQARRQRACLSQEQLAARAELSERTVYQARDEDAAWARKISSTSPAWWASGQPRRGRCTVQCSEEA